MKKVYNGKFIKTRNGFIRIDEICAFERHGSGVFIIMKNGHSIDYGYFDNPDKEIHDLMDIISSYENENLG